MSLDISILIGENASAEEVLAEVRAEGLLLNPKQMNLWEGTLVGIHIILLAQPELEDDAGLPLSQFGLQLSLTRYAGDDSGLQESLAATLGLLLGRRLSKRRGWRCLVVRNLQIKIAEY